MTKYTDSKGRTLDTKGDGLMISLIHPWSSTGLEFTLPEGETGRAKLALEILGIKPYSVPTHKGHTDSSIKELLGEAAWRLQVISAYHEAKVAGEAQRKEHEELISSPDALAALENYNKRHGTTYATWDETQKGYGTPDRVVKARIEELREERVILEKLAVEATEDLALKLYNVSVGMSWKSWDRALAVGVSASTMNHWIRVAKTAQEELA